MKRLTFLFFIFSPLLLPAQARIVGFVKLQNSGGQALPNAETWAIGCAGKDARYSDSKGYFELEFPNKSAGDVIRNISVTLSGYELVNKKKLESYGLLKQPTDNPLIIVLCRQGNYRKAAAGYYQTILEEGHSELKAEKARLEKRLEEERSNRQAIEAQLAEITTQLDNLPQVAEAAADYFAKIDLDQASQLQQKAIKALEAGKVQAALEAMPEELMDQQLATALERKQQLEAQLAETNQLIEQSIENYVFKAQLFVSTGNYAAAERLYEKAIAADTSNRELRYDYAVFLEEINRYDKALALFEQISRKAKHSWWAANAYSYMGNIYKETGHYRQAHKAYAKNEGLYDSLSRTDPGNAFYKENLAIAYAHLGDLHLAQSAYDSALAYYRLETTLYQSLYQSHPDSWQAERGFALALSRIGEAYHRSGVLDSAQHYYRRYFQIQQEIHQDQPEKQGHQYDLAIAYEKLAMSYREAGRFDTANYYFRQERALLEQLHQAAPWNLDYKHGLSIAYSQSRALYQRTGDLDTALAFAQKDLKLVRELHLEQPGNLDFWSGLGIAYLQSGDILEALDSTAQAIAYYNQAAQVFRNIFEAKGIVLYQEYEQTAVRSAEAARLSQLPVSDRLEHLLQQAESVHSITEKLYYQQWAVDILDRLLDAINGEDQDFKDWVAEQYSRLSYYLLFDRQFAKAEAAARRGVALAPKNTANIYLAMALLYQGRYSAAESICQRQPDLWAEHFMEVLQAMEEAGATHPDAAKIRRLLKP